MESAEGHRCGWDVAIDGIERFMYSSMWELACLCTPMPTYAHSLMWL
jgi:hypothetical protein